MPRDTQLITFISDQGSLSQELIQKYANASREKKERFKSRKGKLVTVSKPVEVKVMDIRWLIKGKKAFFDLTPFLKFQDNEKLYQADFIKSLTFEYWGEYQVNVILWL